MGSCQKITLTSIPNTCERRFVKAVKYHSSLSSNLWGLELFQPLEAHDSQLKAIHKWKCLPWLLGKPTKVSALLASQFKKKWFREQLMFAYQHRYSFDIKINTWSVSTLKIMSQRRSFDQGSGVEKREKSLKWKLYNFKGMRHTRLWPMERFGRFSHIAC